MFRWIRERRIAARIKQVQRLTQLAKEMDELLAFGRLSDDTRQQLQVRRAVLDQRARQVMLG